MRSWTPIRNTLLAALLLALPAVMIVAPAGAEIPTTMTIQGVLTDASGTPVPDGEHYVIMSLYDVPVGGSDIWQADSDVQTRNGVFSINLDLFNLDASAYANALWLELTLDPEPPMTPRIRLTMAPYAQRAAVADSVVGGGGAADDDWEISGVNIYREIGQVIVGSAPAAKRAPSRKDPAGESRDFNDSKLVIDGDHGGLYTTIVETDNNDTGRSAIFASRDRTQRSDGSGPFPNQANSAITGYNLWGDSYTFGVAGYTWFDFPQTAALFGQSVDYGNWGAIAYVDDDNIHWGMYTPTDLHVGGLIETDMISIANGAAPGFLLTSDASGNAFWAAPGAAVSDDDWVIQGSHLTHNSNGAVALGTDTPVCFSETWAQATLQVSGPISPAVVLDRTTPSFSRWNIYQIGEPGSLNFSHTATAGVPSNQPVLTIQHTNRQVTINNDAGDDVIRMQANWPMEEEGPAIYMYNPDDPSTTSLILDGHNGGGGGGSVYAMNGAGHLEVSIHGNYAGTGHGRVITPVLEITGGSDLSEQFDIENAMGTPEPGMVVCIDPDNPGQLSLSGKAYDRRVAGVISGAGGVNTGMLMGQRGSEADGDLPVALVGRVYVWADADSGPIEPGDLLTTADRPGHAMKVGDHSQATGSILGKAMTGLQEGQGLILTLVSLQ